jgi:hypothetical protein
MQVGEAEEDHDELRLSSELKDAKLKAVEAELRELKAQLEKGHAVVQVSGCVCQLVSVCLCVHVWVGLCVCAFLCVRVSVHILQVSGFLIVVMSRFKIGVV